MYAIRSYYGDLASLEYVNNIIDTPDNQTEIDNNLSSQTNIQPTIETEQLNSNLENNDITFRITSYNVCYTKLLR